MLLNIDMSGKKAVVIGGGKVAWRKIRSLLANGVQVSVVAPFALDEIGNLAQPAGFSYVWAIIRSLIWRGCFWQLPLPMTAE